MTEPSVEINEKYLYLKNIDRYKSKSVNKTKPQQQEESMRYWNCYRCGRQIPFDGKIKVIDGQVYHPNCPAKRPADLPEAGASAERISSVMHSANKSRLIKIAAELLTSIQLSDCGEDYTFKIPKYMLRQIETQSNRLREIAIELKEISDRIK
jgi:hypothetical protein